MGHAAHFLRRLDRVSDGHVELALALYNDLELLREVLARAVLPEGAERVAISLDDPIEGPFVVVTREGRFVTCLGAGMLVSDLPIVTRERLDAAAARVERMREELGRVRALRESGAEGKAGLAFTRMQQQGPRFAREDAETLIRVQPLIEEHCLRHITELCALADKAADRLVTLRLDAPRRLSPAEQEQLLAFGDAVWGIAHVLVLLRSSSMRTSLERREDEHAELGSMIELLAKLTFEWGTFTHVTRALWFVASGGKRALASVKAIVGEELHDRLYRELALTAIGLGSEKLRAEAQKALVARVVPPADPEGDPFEAIAAHFAAQASGILDGSARHEQMYFRVSRRYAVQASMQRKEVSQEEMDAVPEDVARIAYINSPVSVHHTALLDPLLVSMHGLPWLVRASPAELFLPAEWARKLVRPRGLRDVLYWLRPYAENRCLRTLRRKPRRVEAAPGRNDPCPCGSGKKHKRCCGAR